MDTATLSIDRDFAGHGIDKCRICGEPTRDHQLKPCPEWGFEVIYAAPPRGRQVADGKCKRCGEPARKRSNGNYTLYCSDNCRKLWHVRR